MRQVLIVVSLFCLSFICKGQVKDNQDYLKASKLYIVDGIPVPKEKIKQDDILIIQTVSGKKLSEGIYDIRPDLDSVIVIVTKQSATKQYQIKLSAFSREYESYLKGHNNKDDDIQYIVHSDPLEKQEVLNFLYKLPPEKIIGVTFTERPGPNGTGTQKTVIIETKVGE